jgi:TPR repeat protein
MWRLESRGRRALGAALLLCAASSICGCAQSSGSYAGIPLAAGAADPEIQNLARRARASDKQAQLQLGIRYEEGLGIAPNLRRARSVYLAASRTTGGRSALHLPSASGKGGVATIPVSTGPRVEGLAEARHRLWLLNRQPRVMGSGE